MFLLSNGSCELKASHVPPSTAFSFIQVKWCLEVDERRKQSTNTAVLLWDIQLLSPARLTSRA